MLWDVRKKLLIRSLVREQIMFWPLRKKDERFIIRFIPAKAEADREISIIAAIGDFHCRTKSKGETTLVFEGV
jgi:hypothetical protein